jgi:hypothetical protein
MTIPTYPGYPGARDTQGKEDGSGVVGAGDNPSVGVSKIHSFVISVKAGSHLSQVDDQWMI